MIDGVVIGKNQVVTVALGILEDGAKKFLGYQTGSGENTQICKDLLNRLESRGLKMPEEQYFLAFADDFKLHKMFLRKNMGMQVYPRIDKEAEREVSGRENRKSKRGRASPLRGPAHRAPQERSGMRTGERAEEWRSRAEKN